MNIILNFGTGSSIRMYQWRPHEVKNDSVKVPVVHSVFKNERNAKNPIKEWCMHNKGSLQKFFKQILHGRSTWSICYIFKVEFKIHFKPFWFIFFFFEGFPNPWYIALLIAKVFSLIWMSVQMMLLMSEERNSESSKLQIQIQIGNIGQCFPSCTFISS